MTKAELLEKLQETHDADSCCPELKEAIEKYQASLGTADEAEAAKALVAELEEDVCDIDGFMAFLSSDHGKQIFGEEAAAQMMDAAKDAKAKGVRYCICPACTAGGAVLDHKDVLLGE